MNCSAKVITTTETCNTHFLSWNLAKKVSQVLPFGYHQNYRFWLYCELFQFVTETQQFTALKLFCFILDVPNFSLTKKTQTWSGIEYDQCTNPMIKHESVITLVMQMLKRKMDVRKSSFIKSLKQLPTIMTFFWHTSKQTPQIPKKTVLAWKGTSEKKYYS